MSDRPRLVDFVRTDFASLLLSLSVPVALGLAAWAALGLPIPSGGRFLNDQPFEYFAPGAATLFLVIASGGFILAAISLALRLRAARRAFRGIQVQGRIVKIVKFKDRAYIHFEYRQKANDYCTWRFVHQTAAVKALCVGQVVHVALDPEHPTAAWIDELFER